MFMVGDVQICKLLQLLQHALHALYFTARKAIDTTAHTNSAYNKTRSRWKLSSNSMLFPAEPTCWVSSVSMSNPSPTGQGQR
jgi:hypothetical protein